MRTSPRRSTARSCGGRCRGRSAARSSCGSSTRTAPAPTRPPAPASRPNRSGPGIETFPTQLPIHSGDLIAIDSTNPTDEIGVATVAGAGYGIFSAPPFEGSTNAPALVEIGPGDRARRRSPARPGDHRGDPERRLRPRRPEGDDHRHQPGRRERRDVRRSAGDERSPSSAKKRSPRWRRRRPRSAASTSPRRRWPAKARSAAATGSTTPAARCRTLVGKKLGAAKVGAARRRLRSSAR